MEKLLSMNPFDVAQWTKKRFGEVGPGTDEYQRVHRANSRASVVSTGSCAGGKHFMMSGAVVGVTPDCCE